MTGRGWVDGPLVGFDLETTGLDREHDEPVSYAFVEFVDGHFRRAEEGFLLPTRAISRGAATVHSLSRERLTNLGAVALDDGIRHVAERLRRLSAESVPVVGCNLAYDLTMVDRVLSRLDLPTSLHASGWRGPVLDVLVLDRGFDVDFEARPVRALEALCAYYDLDAPTHTARSDAEAAVRVLLALASRFMQLRVTGVDELQARQASWHMEWCGALSQRRREAGRAALRADEAAWPYVERRTLF